jgi:hypothetical protein
MFGKILHANDGSEHAFRALALALAIAKQNRSELHIVCVEEIPFLPEFMEEVRENMSGIISYLRVSTAQQGRSALASKPSGMPWPGLPQPRGARCSPSLWRSRPGDALDHRPKLGRGAGEGKERRRPPSRWRSCAAYPAT